MTGRFVNIVVGAVPFLYRRIYVDLPSWRVLFGLDAVLRDSVSDPDP